jgi:uncharacterized cupredoxin-like copper-binding protein
MNTNVKRSTLILATLVIFSTVLAACGPSGSSSKAVEVQVTLTDFKVESSLTTFSVGTPYHFVITNKGSVAHEIEIMPPAGDAKQALLSVGEKDLQAGASKAVDYTFTTAAPEGTLEFACHIAGHYEAGMHLPIVVK